ncbi:putative domain HDIG-containing protein [Frankia torreyi]|uniref:Putative domain HDIG-containing protein n=1 Tax=Frankia torreyi TaxID=1856 RepID=A0A0D8BPE6_9ACTN|nr:MULTISPECIES: HD domain-containing protein [Frankia]KJE25247.1 putative domain HDIG-containing protein [Frankia torreyi]KQC37819.1 phosphohydrolase [Frankia sp. ACN1ag]KQM07937.1 putative domain HDIG-containing protein [Frankia sp. CpI1-P]
MVIVPEPSWDVAVDADELHRRHAPSQPAFTLVHTHCRIVWDLAAGLLAAGAAPQADAGLVRTGALLHDIGVYRLYDDAGQLDHAQYLRHGVLGHELLAADGLPETVCRFASCHTGVGLTRADIAAGDLPLPPGDYVAQTVEERLVMYADKFHSKSNPSSFLTVEAYRGYVRRFGADKVARFDELTAEFGVPDLAALAARHGMTVRGG